MTKLSDNTGTEYAIRQNTGIGKKRYFFRRLIKERYLHLMILPAVLSMLIFSYMPLYYITAAFRDYKIFKPLEESAWVGFKFFIEFFNDERFFLIIRNTLGISILRLVIGFPLPIILAILIDELRQKRFKSLVQTVSYFPHFVSWVILGGIVIDWLSTGGMIPSLLTSLGLIDTPENLLSIKKLFWPILLVSDIWKEIGWRTIIYLAAIAGINAELYQSAIVDGANRFRRIWHITAPGIKGTVVILFILSCSNLMSSNFDQLMVLSNPLVYDVSDVLDIYVYRVGMQLGRYSSAAAIGLFQSVISLALLLGANRLSRKLAETSLF